MVPSPLTLPFARRSDILKRLALFFTATFALVFTSRAQAIDATGANTALTDVLTLLQTWWPTLLLIIYIVGGLALLAGLVPVVNKHRSNDQQAWSYTGGWALALGALLIGPGIIERTFGLGG